MENEYHYIETLKDMYLLLERCRRLAEDMHEKTPTRYGYILECCGCLDYMCECTIQKLFNLSGGLASSELVTDFNMCDWAHGWNKKQEGKHGH